MTGKMIVIDGVDGSGKSLQKGLLFNELKRQSIDVILTREPGGSHMAEQIRTLLISGEPDSMDSMTELLLMYASRRAHLRDTIWPALAKDQWVISDRFADSSRAIQGIAGELGLPLVEDMHRIVTNDFKPDLVLIFDVPVDVALNRTYARGNGEDRFEKKGLEFHQRVRDAFISIARNNPKTHIVIDASKSIEEVTIDMIDAVNEHFNLGEEINPQL